MALDETIDRNRETDSEATVIEASEYAERLELLYEVAERASSVPEVSKLLEEILSITQRILRASAASLFLIDQEKEELYVQAAGGVAANALRPIRLDLLSGIVGWVANHGTPVMLNDVTMDNRFNKDIDKVTGFVTKAILAMPLIRARRVIGVLEVLNKSDGSPFNDQDLRVLNGLASTEALILLVSMAATAITNIKLSQAALDSCKSTVETLVTAADARDPYAWGHSKRVKKYTLMAAGSLPFTAKELRVIEFGALLHDIGKIGISESILRKSGPLSAEEWYVVRKHPFRGANIVFQIPYLDRSRDIVLNHHERYDGTGYPEGLKGEDIPIGARLVAVADAFDTMTTDHSYRAALTVEEAMVELGKGTGTQFCPAAVEAFITGFKKQEDGPGDGTRGMAQWKGGNATDSAEEALSTKASGKVQDAVGGPVRAVPAKVGAPAQTVAQEDPSGSPAGAGLDTYEGEVEMVVPPPVHFGQVRQFQEALRQVGNLRIVVVGGSPEEGTVIVVSAQTPTALVGLLQEMPTVEKAEETTPKGKRKIVVTLKPFVDD